MHRSGRCLRVWAASLTRCGIEPANEDYMEISMKMLYKQEVGDSGEVGMVRNA